VNQTHVTGVVTSEGHIPGDSYDVAEADHDKNLIALECAKEKDIRFNPIKSEI